MARRRAESPANAALAVVHKATAAIRSWAGQAWSAADSHRGWTAAGVGLLSLGLVLSLLPESGVDSESTSDNNGTVKLVSEFAQPLELGESETLPPEAGDEFEDQQADADRDWTLVEVRPGQTLERIFRDQGLSAGLLHRVVHHDDQTRSLARIRPGDTFGFDLNEAGEFLAMRADLDDERWLIVEQAEDGLTTHVEYRDLETRVVEATGIISSSLFNAAAAAGLSDNMTMRLANIFGWDIDFALDIRSGDRFALVYEEIWRDGEFLRDGTILAARFVNRGESFEAIRFDAGDGPDYFAPDGRPMRRAFLRAPLNFTRVTSNFNPRRFHPITQRRQPHNGTDYGAPTGTPVWAAGDGRVIRSAYNNANGNYIFIQHGNNIVTRYLHLNRRHVRVGARVRQGETIGTVGMTGMATGPHLHYEFLVDGVHRNPRTVELPDAEPLPAEQMDAFRNAGEPLLAMLDDLQGPSVLLAQRQGDDDGCSGADSDC